MNRIFLTLVLLCSLASGRNVNFVKSPGGGGGGFTPTSITNLLAWGDCSDVSKITKDGSNNITHVTDKSTNAYDFFYVLGQPVYTTNVQNSLSTCRYSANNAFLAADITSVTNPTSFTQCAIFKASSLAQDNSIFAGYSSITNAITLEIGVGGNQLGFYFTGVGAFGGTGGGSITTSSWYRACLDYDQGASPKGTIYINNVSSGTTTQGSGFMETHYANVGSDAGGGFNGWHGDIGEWVWSSPSMSSGDRASLDSYWKTKWGL